MKLEWEQFKLHNPDTTTQFENLCRHWFEIKFVGESDTTHSNPNQAGVEVEPYYIGDEWISFQAKYFEKEISYSQIKESLGKIPGKYPGKMDKVYLCSNQTINTDNKSYKAIVDLLSPHGVSVIPVSNRDLLSQIERLPQLVEIYWGKEYAKETHQMVQHLETMVEELLEEKKSTLEAEDTPLFGNDNQKYADSFNSPLFLHPKNGNVCLENLFVWQSYEAEGYSTQPLVERISDFVRNGNKTILFLEGDAGTGKTTVIQWHANCFQNNIEEWKRLYGNRQLLVVRLGDFNSDIRKQLEETKDLFRCLCVYMNISEESLRTNIADFLLVLDGFDDLCTVESKIDSKNLLRHFRNTLPIGSKTIITSRTSYLKRNTDSKSVFIKLNPFSKSQRIEWITNYKDKCKLAIDSHIEAFLNEIGDEKSIYDIPLNLYMLIAKCPTEEDLGNMWLLFRSILFDDIRDTQANQMVSTKESNLEHSAAENWDIYYQICEEIAYEMYIHGNSKPYIEGSHVKKIIREVFSRTYGEAFQTDDARYLENFHLLCGFWKTDQRRNTYEFYHNDLRDFFLCEKIYRELNSFYQEEWDSNRVIEFGNKVGHLFLYGCLERRVLDFIQQRAKSGHISEDGSEDFSIIEYSNHHIADLMGAILQDGTLVTNDLKQNPMANISHIIKCTLEVFHEALIPYLTDEEIIKFWINAISVKENRLLQYVLSRHECTMRLSHTDFSALDLSYVGLCPVDFAYSELRETNFHKSNLRLSDFSYSDMQGCNFESADMKKTQLIHAKMQNTILDKAELSDADLSFAVLNDSTARGANLSATTMNFVIWNSAIAPNSNLENAKLVSAVLDKADLSNSNLSGADLRNASLKNVALQQADLRGVNFSGANLEGANINMAQLSSKYDEMWNYNTFPCESLNKALFEVVFVDGKKYRRKEFLEKYQQEKHEEMVL